MIRIKLLKERNFQLNAKIKEVASDRIPNFDLPFSQAIIHNETVYLSGTVPVDIEEPGDLEDLNISGDTIAEQTEAVMNNAEIILQAAGTSLDNLIKVTAYLDDIADFDEFNRTYKKFISKPYPVRSTFEVSSLADDFKVEIEFTAAV